MSFAIHFDYQKPEIKIKKKKKKRKLYFFRAGTSQQGGILKAPGQWEPCKPCGRFQEQKSEDEVEYREPTDSSEKRVGKIKR